MGTLEKTIILSVIILLVYVLYVVQWANDHFKSMDMHA